MSRQSQRDLTDWNRVADSYMQAVGGPGDPIYRQLAPVLWECLGDVEGLNVLDLGCGHGWFSSKLLEAGARVTGVDGSAALLERAREAYPEVTFMQHDLSTGLPEADVRFDRVVAHMVLMDIPEIAPLVRDVRSSLKTQGKFVFTMPHPCFFNQKMRMDERTGQPFRAVTGYHRKEVWRINGFGGHNHYHRSLTFYFDLLRKTGFTVSRLFEPEHIPAHEDELADFWRSIPVFLLLEAVC